MQLERFVEAPGNGVDFPKPGDVIDVHYTCWAYVATVADRRGRQFATSRHDGVYSVSIANDLGGVGKVIQGWDTLIVQMSLGERSILHVPSALAYGPLGFPGLIPTNTDLIFEVELLLITARPDDENDGGDIDRSNPTG